MARLQRGSAPPTPTRPSVRPSRRGSEPAQIGLPLRRRTSRVSRMRDIRAAVEVLENAIDYISFFDACNNSERDAAAVAAVGESYASL